VAQANFAEWQVHVIIYYQKVAQRNVMLVHQASYGFAAEIHKCVGLSQHQLLTAYFANAHPSLALPSVKADRMKPGKVVQAPEAYIVPIMDISLARISQTNYEFHSASLMSPPIGNDGMRIRVASSYNTTLVQGSLDSC
jgi:hypothetical protein